MNKKKKLPDHCSVFQAEVRVIHRAINWRIGEVFIFSESKAALKALTSWSIDSKTVLECRSAANTLAESTGLTLCWVPGHRDIGGNCKADELGGPSSL